MRATRERCDMCHSYRLVVFRVPDEVWAPAAVHPGFRNLRICAMCFALGAIGRSPEARRDSHLSPRLDAPEPPDWAAIEKDFAPMRPVTVTAATLRLALAALEHAQHEDAYDNRAAAIGEIHAALKATQ